NQQILLRKSRVITKANQTHPTCQLLCRTNPIGLLYRAQEGFVNLDSARQSKIDLNERDHCTPCKASEEDRFCEAAASPNSQNLTERGIYGPHFLNRKSAKIIQKSDEP